MRKVLLAFGSLLLAGSFQANAITKSCYDCSQAQMEVLVNESIFEMRAEPLYVVDQPNGIVRKYFYYSDWTGNPDDPHTIGWYEATPEPHISQGIAYVRGIIRAAGQEVIEVNPNAPNMPSDVYQALRESHFQDDINNYVNLFTDAAEHNKARDFLNSVTGNFFNPTALNVSIMLKWSDGSSYRMKWDSTLNQFVYVLGTARDGNGNKVPDSVNEIGGQTYVFYNTVVGGTSNGADDLADLWNYLMNMGVTVIDASAYTSVTYKLVMTCTPTTCSFYYVPY